MMNKCNKYLNINIKKLNEPFILENPWTILETLKTDISSFEIKKNFKTMNSTMEQYLQKPNYHLYLIKSLRSMGIQGRNT